MSTWSRAHNVTLLPKQGCNLNGLAVLQQMHIWHEFAEPGCGLNVDRDHSLGSQSLR